MIHEATVAEAVAQLRAGRAVVIPTDTVYGLAADPHNPAAVEALFALKGRAETNPIPVLVPDVATAKRCSGDWTAAADALARAFWPGPLTIVVEKAEWVPRSIVAGEDSVGLRAPDHPAALEVLRHFGAPLACTSANLSGQPAASRVDRLPVEWEGRICVLDVGGLSERSPSTVVDARGGETPRILRAGPVSEDEVRECVASGK